MPKNLTPPQVVSKIENAAYYLSAAYDILHAIGDRVSTEHLSLILSDLEFNKNSIIMNDGPFVKKK